MNPPPPGPRGGDETPAPPLLPRTGVDSAAMFDLPYATDDAPPASPVTRTTAPAAPAPADPRPGDASSAPLAPRGPVVPPTFSSPRSPSPLGTGQAARREPATLPGPLNAGPLVGAALLDDDDDVEVDPMSAGETAPDLPPMVAKGAWDQPATPPASRAPAGSPLGAGATPPGGALAFSPDAPTAAAPAVAPPPGSTGGSTDPAPGPFTPLTIGATLPPPRPVPVAPATRTRLFDGFLVATAAAAVAAGVWWAAVTVTERQFAYLALVLAIGVGQAALVGGRRGSLSLGVVTGVVTLLAFTAIQYFIARSLAIIRFDAEVPLWTGASTARDIVRETFEEDRLTGLFVVGASLVAGIQAGLPGRRAAGPLGAPPPPAPARPPIL